ncbi:copper resistance CopC/CopD family protein [Streptomyces kronopolitis]|uniref:copper resistance CopC/CopD family protein n=1 Tax=Streptomyces kronopolitis TaxID=1612435 RepID=UPI0020BD8F1F|nr:FixH family protein [Streptomyces kronopolitis]MCL6297388.1 copper resistance protein CopC/CopD [Streptomyces kronopolitis]
MVTTGLRPGRSAVLRLLVVAMALAGALLGGLGGAAPASAHAALTGSTPAQGAVVDHAPGQVALTFSEGVAMGDDSIRVLDPKGKRVDAGKLRNLSSGTVVKYGAGLPAGLGNGTYTVAWQAVSADSHPVSGAFTFSVGAPSKTTAAVPQDKAGGGLVGALYGIARALAYTGFVLLVGGAAFVVACRPAAALVRSVQRLVVQGWALLTGTTVAMLLLRTPYTGSGDLADVFDFGGLQQVLVTKPGAALVSRLLLLAAAALLVAVLFGAYARTQEPAEPGEEPLDPAVAERQRKDLTFGLGIGGAIIAAGLAATWAMAEHASTGLQTAVAMPVDVLHLLAVATWLGGLAALVASLYWGPPVERVAVRRFSRIAFGSVLVLVATGIYQSWRQVGTWRALTDTTYGWLLLLKAGLVTVLVGIAWVSRRWTGRLAEVPAGEELTAEADEVSGASEADAAGADEEKDGAEAAEAEAKADADTEVGAEKAGVGVAAAATTGAATAGSARATRPATGSGSGSADTPDTPDTSDAPEDAPTPDASEASADTPAPDPARAAQLARQQAALDSAQAKRKRDADPERRGLRRSVLAEAAVAAVVLVVTTVLTATEPARTEEAVKATSGGQSAAAARPQALTVPFDTGGPHGKGTARLDLSPGSSTAANTVRLRLTDPSGKPMDVPEVKLAFTQKAKKLGPLPATLRNEGKGRWSASGVRLPVPGQWQLSLVVRTSDIDQVTEIKNVKIGS